VQKDHQQENFKKWAAVWKRGTSEEEEKEEVA
jgi:hypothetical protein